MQSYKRAHLQGNTHFMKKLPPGAEASNVLIGEVEFLQHHITAFVRLKTATLLGDLTEVQLTASGGEPTQPTVCVVF